MTVSIEYSFTQTLDGICLVIPNVKVPISKACIFVSDIFLRLTIGCYHLEVNFFDKIETNSIRVTENDGIHYIRLSKQKKELWSTLLFQGTKEDILLRKEKSLQRRELEMKQLIDRAHANRFEEERTILRGQMNLEKEERDEISRLKADEERIERIKLYQSMNQLQTKGSYGDKRKDHVLGSISEERIRSTPIRQAYTLQFTHSFRFFKTAIRESTSIQEQAYILKNRPYMKGKQYFNSDEHDLGLNDVSLLKENGDKFYAAKDYLSAINVYSTIIDIDPLNISAYSNRSAAYLMIEEPSHCIRDCMKILDISLKNNNEREQTIVSMKKINLRLSFAYFQLDVLGRSNGFELALKHFLMRNDDLSYEGDKLKNLIQCRKLKRKGDVAMRNKNFSSAIELYTCAIEVGKENTLLSVYVNRASSFAACSKHVASINDCSFVLKALSCDLCDSTKPFSVIPKYGADERRFLAEICITKRAYNYLKMNKLSACESDLLDASMLCNKKFIVERDLNKVRKKLLI